MRGGVQTLSSSQVLQQTPVFHELSHNVDWLLQGADGVELEEVWVSESLHHLSLLDKVIHLHRPWISWGTHNLLLRSGKFREETLILYSHTMRTIQGHTLSKKGKIGVLGCVRCFLVAMYLVQKRGFLVWMFSTLTYHRASMYGNE